MRQTGHREIAELTDCHQATSSNAGEGAHDIEQPDVVCHGTAQASHHEGDGRNEETGASPEDVAEPAI